MMRSTILALFLLTCTLLKAQVDDHVALVSSAPVRQRADNAQMGFKDGAVPGTVEFHMPQGTHRIDLLNARGRVERTLTGSDMHHLDLGGLRCGTWTLRAHTMNGLNVRRFVVMERGRIAWAVPPLRRRP